MTTDRKPATTPDAAAAKAVTSAAEPKPKAPFLAAAEVVQTVQLSTVHFTACSAQLLETVDVIPEGITFSGLIRFSTPTVRQVGDGFLTRTTLLFKLLGGELPSDKGSSKKPYVVVRATLEARYDLKPDTPQFSEDDLKDFALCYCPFHVWGYWREFVQSSLARLDLPQITLPLFLISQAPGMVQDKLD